MRKGTALHGLILLVVALVTAAFLNAQGLRKTAEIQQPGTERDVGLALTKPLAHVSHTLYLDRPRHELKVALGRGSDDVVDTKVALPPPPPKKKPEPVTRAPSQPKRSRVHRTRPAPPPRPVLPVFTSQHPLRLWVAGDSLAEIPGEALERRAGSGSPLDVVGLESRLDTGLTRPDLFNWFTRFSEAISQLKPRAAVLFFGADDEHSYMSGVPSGVTVGALGSPSWIAEYRRRVDGLTRELNQAGIYVVWVGLPITRGPGYRFGFRVVNHILEDVVAAHPGSSTFVGTWSLFVDKHGKYADYLANPQGRLVLMRSPDGVHYQPAAGDLIAAKVISALSRVFALR
jgi:hypothetical protein